MTIILLLTYSLDVKEDTEIKEFSGMMKRDIAKLFMGLKIPKDAQAIHIIQTSDFLLKQNVRCLYYMNNLRIVRNFEPHE